MQGLKGDFRGGDDDNNDIFLIQEQESVDIEVSEGVILLLDHHFSSCVVRSLRR
jgi:hypothetical protein